MTHHTLKNKKGYSDEYAAFMQYNEVEKEFVMSDFSGGVCTKPFSLREHTAASLRNMQAEGKALYSLSLPQRESPALCAGDVTDEIYADGVWLLRKGKTLYARKDGCFRIIGVEGMMQESYGAIFHAGSSFFVIDGTRILCVEQNLSYGVVEQEPTMWYIEVAGNGESYMENEKPNPFCRYLEYRLKDVAYTSHTIPKHLAVDSGYAEVFTESGYPLPTSNYTFSEGKITFHDFEANNCIVRLRLAESSTDAEKISFASLAEARELFAGAGKMQETFLPSHSAVYLFKGKAEENRVYALLTDGIWSFSKLSEKLLLSCSFGERVMGLMAYGEGYLVFTEGAVKKLFLTEDLTLERIFFTTQRFKNDFGSDMEGSICAFDDKIIFANSRSGVFYINKNNISERDVSRHVSENIEDGDDGFFSHMSEEYQSATACCAFGKYYLTVGGTTYIWDYSARLPSSSQSYEDEARMVWTVCDAWQSALYLREAERRLYYQEKDTEQICYLIPENTSAEEISCGMKTAESDFGVKTEKRLTGLLITYRAASEMNIHLSYDGVLSPVCYKLPATDGFETVRLRIHGKRFHRCTVEISSEASMAVSDIVFRYL